MSLKQQHISLDQFLQEPEEKPYKEYLYGQVVQKAMPKLKHGLIQGRICYLLEMWVTSGAGGKVGPEIRCILTTPSERHVQLPDVAWFAQKPQVDEKDNVLTAPDLAIEILSPDDPFSRVQKKIRIYLEAGTRVVWIVDPDELSVTICRRTQERLTVEGDAVLEDTALPGLALRLVDLFQPLTET